jgi:hypothetical protein
MPVKDALKVGMSFTDLNGELALVIHDAGKPVLVREIPEFIERSRGLPVPPMIHGVYEIPPCRRLEGKGVVS